MSSLDLNFEKKNVEYLTLKFSVVDNPCQSFDPRSSVWRETTSIDDGIKHRVHGQLDSLIKNTSLTDSVTHSSTQFRRNNGDSALNMLCCA
jgi:hypothetical protein